MAYDNPTRAALRHFAQKLIIWNINMYTMEELFLSGLTDNSKCMNIRCSECPCNRKFNDLKNMCNVVGDFEQLLDNLKIHAYGR